MDYYVTKTGGSLLFREPRKLKLVAGDHIPAEFWNTLKADAQAVLIRDGAVEGFDDPDSVQLSEPAAPEQPIKIGVGKGDFMPEARVQRGERRDAALEELMQKQRQAEVDAENGGSPDGVVQVELPAEDEFEDDDEFDDLTPEERAEILRLEDEEN
jgi:hypothetical protein